MDAKQLTLPGQLVKKHNELVRSKITLDSHQGSKILASLIACIRSEDTSFKEIYSIAVKDILSAQGGENYKRIKNVCRELVKATVEFEWPDPENPDGDPIFHALTFFSSVKYRKGIVEARFSAEPEIANCLLALRERFTQYNLIEYLKLPSIYSQRIFEILKSWSGLPEVVLQLDELHHMLNTPESLKANFKDFRRRVLVQAHKDINDKTDLSFEWEPVKRGRSVESIRFIFAPGRKAIAEANRQKAETGRTNATINKKFVAAEACARCKNGDCVKKDNKPAICAMCIEQGFCDELAAKKR